MKNILKKHDISLRLLSLLLSVVPAAAKGLSAEKRKEISQMLTRILDREVAGCKTNVTQVVDAGNRLTLYASIGMSYYPFRERSVAAIYDSIRSLLPASLARRRAIVERYERNLGECDVELLRHYGEDFESSGHLMLVRLTGKSSAFRNALIERMADDGGATNVHYKPLPLLTAYRDLGFAIADFPNALAQFENEVTLPLHTLLSDEDVDYVAGSFKRALDGLEAEGVR